MEEKVIYNKTCKYSKCGKAFQSEARNTRYCSDECYAGAQKENKAKAKKNSDRRKKYDNDKELARLAARCYALSRDIAMAVLPSPPNDGQKYELHHYQMDPFNCSPLNMTWVVKGRHENYHQVLPEADVVFVLKEIKKNPEYLEELRVQYEQMLSEGRLDANVFSVLSFLGTPFRKGGLQSAD